MESLINHFAVKNRSHRSENIWAPTNKQSLPSFTIHNSSIHHSTQSAYMYGYLIVEKNSKNLFHKLKKILIKRKRTAFFKIMELKDRLATEKKSQFTINLAPSLHKKSQYEKQMIDSVNPQSTIAQISTVCRRTIQQKLGKIYWKINLHLIKSLVQGFSSLQVFYKRKQSDFIIDNVSGYEFQSNLKGTNNGSRVSNKRKTTKNTKGDEIKQNSNSNNAQFSIENQRLRNELLGEDFERDQFAQKMHQLLDYHQKYLLQGSTTTRGKKQR